MNEAVPIANPAQEATPLSREKWLTDTLYALRGHFREATPADPNNLRTMEDVSEGLIIRCMDRNLNEKQDLHLPKGELFEATPPGAAVAPPELGLNTTLQAQLAVAYGTAGKNSTKAPKPLIIIGHDECGANQKLHNGLLKDKTRESDAVLNTMLPMAPDGLQQALKDAKDRGADDNKVRRMMEQITVLQSMQNLHNESFHCDGEHIKISDLVADGKFQIIGAIRSYDEGHPLKVYDPEHHQFRQIEELYREAFPGANRFSEQAIIDRKNAQEQPVLPTGGQKVRAAKGATTHTAHSFNMRQIDDGVKFLLDAVHELKGIRL
jgi:carbonic anhydrase